MEKNPKRMYRNVTEMIGSTPMLKLNNYPRKRGVKCEVFCKLEGFNPGGSIKDRVGNNMVVCAERDGLIKPGDTVVESSSGNTGMGIVLASLVRGYKVLITTRDKEANEKIARLESMGAEVIITPSEATRDSPENFYNVAQEYNKKEGFWQTNQYCNQNNPNSHYLTTGPEIIEQMEGHLDYLFVSIGTGGTVTGIGKRFKKDMPHCKIIAIDPFGSVLSKPESLNVGGFYPYTLEAIGNELQFEIIDYSVIDEFVKVGDQESFIACRELMKEEGIFPGSSSGACLIGALKYLKEKGLAADPHLRCVLIFPDNSSNYISKFPRNEWMVGKAYWPPEILYKPNHPLAEKTIHDFEFIKPIPFVRPEDTLTLADCALYFRQGLSAVAVIRKILDEEVLNGRIDKTSLMKFKIQKNLALSDDARKCKIYEALYLDFNVSFAAVQKMLEERQYIFLVKKENKTILQIYSVTNDDLFTIYDSINTFLPPSENLIF